jgi:guanyl-specific ribonuclease Sa
VIARQGASTTPQQMSKEAVDAYRYLKNNNFSYAQQGMKGNKVFINDGRQNSAILPQRSINGKITYKEWDVHKNIGGVKRPGERLVSGSDGSIWYTTDHYASFTQIQAPNNINTIIGL